MNGIYRTAPAYAVPGYTSMWDRDIITNDPIAVGLKTTAMDPSGWNGLPWPGPPTAQMSAVKNGNLDTDMVTNVISGKMTADEAIKNAVDASIEIFQEFGAPGVKE